MRISQIRATPVNIGYREPERWSQGSRSGVTAIVVEVETSDGMIGVGESVPAPDPETTMTAIRDAAQLLTGRDPRRIVQNWQDVLAQRGWGAFPHTAHAALAGVEIACWDLLGRSLGVPVHALLGGRVRDTVEFMGFVPYHPDPQRIAAEAERLAGQGFRTLYVKAGFGPQQDLAAAEAVRRGGGPGVQIRIDPNEAWTFDVARRMVFALQEFDLQYVEQPLRGDRLADMAALRRLSPVPIAANQSSWLNHNTFDILAGGAADVVMTDPWQAGGIRAFHAAATMCEIAGVPLVYHSFAPLSIATRAAMQVLAVSSACDYAHQTYHGMLVGDVVADPVRHPGGVQTIGDAPGLGVTLDAERMAQAHEDYRRNGYCSPYGD
ncbi:MAG TPA: mandelate racemase/muconate lactonizing enzyme family protein [Nakamurella sp.]|nr:mandelate racemase/muconate lactonizing enzyme family protein [Nakamurella sp.]